MKALLLPTPSAAIKAGSVGQTLLPTDLHHIWEPFCKGSDTISKCTQHYKPGHQTVKIVNCHSYSSAPLKQVYTTIPQTCKYIFFQVRLKDLTVFKMRRLHSGWCRVIQCNCKGPARVWMWCVPLVRLTCWKLVAILGDDMETEKRQNPVESSYVTGVLPSGECVSPGVNSH